MNYASLISNGEKRWGKFDNLSGPIVVNILGCAKRLSESTTLEDDEKRQSLLKIQKSVHALIKLEAAASARCDASKRVAETVAVGGPDLDILGTFSREMKKADQAAARSRVGKDARAKKIADLLGGNDDDGGEEEEVQVAEESIPRNTKCPITAGPLTKPMKNAACGHVYSYDGSVLLLLQGASRGNTAKTLEEIAAINPNLSKRCPVAGCPKSFGPTTLSRDFATERSQRLQSAVASTANQDEYEDEDINMIE